MTFVFVITTVIGPVFEKVLDFATLSPRNVPLSNSVELRTKLESSREKIDKETYQKRKLQI